MPQKEIINPSSMGQPGPPFSHATKYGNLVFLGGQTAHDSTIGRSEGDIREQVHTVLGRVKLILEEAGTSLENVLDARCYLVDRRDFVAFNEEYRKYFPTDQPARTTVEAQLNTLNGRVEISVVAFVPD